MSEDKSNLGTMYSDERNIRSKEYGKSPDAMRKSAEKVANVGFFLAIGAWAGRLIVFLLNMIGVGILGMLLEYVLLVLAISATIAAVVALCSVIIKLKQYKMQSVIPTAVATLVIVALYFIFVKPVV